MLNELSMDRRALQAERKSPFLMKRIASKIKDLFFYYFLPRKTVIVVMSSMRSGSTLLKAMLAQGGNVSHLPEIDYSNFPGNSYQFYRKAYSLSKEKIIVLKCPDAVLKHLHPTSPRIKAIVLARSAEGAVGSLLERHSQTEFKHRTSSDWFAYWANCYQRIIDSAAAQKIDVRGVRYEDLTANPTLVSERLFAYIGAKRREGIDNYESPRDFDWTWGADDGGEKIRKLRVLPETRRVDDPTYGKTADEDDSVRALQVAFGYRNPSPGENAQHNVTVPWRWL